MFLRNVSVHLLSVGVHVVRRIMSRYLESISLACLLFRRFHRHARAEVDPPVRRFVLRLLSATHGAI